MSPNKVLVSGGGSYCSPLACKEKGRNESSTVNVAIAMLLPVSGCFPYIVARETVQSNVVIVA